MNNIIIPKSEIKVSSQLEVNNRKILARTEYEKRRLAESLENINKQIKYNAECGNKYFIYNPFNMSSFGEKIPYKGIYEDMIYELNNKGYRAKQHKILLSKEDLISIIIEEDVSNVVGEYDLPETIDWNEIKINKYIRRYSLFGIVLGMLAYGLLGLVIVLFVLMITMS